MSLWACNTWWGFIVPGTVWGRSIRYIARDLKEGNGSLVPRSSDIRVPGGARSSKILKFGACPKLSLFTTMDEHLGRPNIEIALLC